MFDHRLESIRGEEGELAACFISELNGAETILTAAQVVIDCGTRPADDLYHALRSGSVNDGVTDFDALLSGRPQVAEARSEGEYELHRIGDAVTSRNVAAATLDAMRLCVTF